MINFKCKMCGATIKASDCDKVVNCDFCGSTQTIPAFDGGKKESLYKRAYALRFSCDFDRARQIFEKIISDFPEEAEAYWGIVLCKYGVEYVDDENTGLKIPTCHRTLDSFIFADSDYLNAIKYSDTISSNIYKKEAEQIDAVQKGILKISMNEDPFDIFICYKENDYSGEQTKDSVYAYDIYKMLNNNGYKVFMSKVTLADKLGTLYEPYIYSALKSARVMIHVTTSLENTESVWVRNEWSRFIKFSSITIKKVFIPCYAGISPSELPIELQGFQGQDLTKIGSLQNLLIGIDNIFSSNRKNSEEKKTVENNYDDLLEKGDRALEAESYENAENFYTKASYESKMPGDAYFGLLLAQYRVNGVESLIKSHWSKLINNENFKLAKQFCDERNKTLKTKLSIIESACNEKEMEYEYDNKKRSLDFALPISSCFSLIKFYENHLDYKDSKSLLVKAKIKYIKAAQTKEDLVKAESILSDLSLEDAHQIDILQSELKNKYRLLNIADLEKKNLFIRIPKDKSIYSFNLVINKYSAKLNVLQKLNDFSDIEKELLDFNENEIIAYLNQILESKTIGYADIETLENIKEQLLYIIPKTNEPIFNKLLQLTDEIIRKEELKKKNELLKKKRKKIKTLIIIGSVVSAIIVGIVVGVVIWNSGYSANKFNLRITDISHDYEDYYSYHLTMNSTLENNSPHDVAEVVYKITFYDPNSVTIATYNVSYSGGIKSKNSYKYTTEFSVSNSDSTASKLWVLSFSELSIKGRIVSAYFADGSSKTYNGSDKNLK